MKRLLGNILTKTLTGKSIDDRNQENFMNFCLANNLTNTDVQKYRLDKDPMDPRFWNQTYIGTCVKDSKKFGLVVTIDENTGYAHGDLFQAEHASMRDKAIADYKKTDCVHGSFQSFFIYEVCNSESTELDDSIKYRA